LVIDEHGNTSGPRHQRTQEFQPLCRKLSRKNIDSRQVAARSGEARNKAKPDRVYADKADDWDRVCRRLGRERGRDTSDRRNHRDPSLHQFRRQRRQPIGLIVGRPVFDGHVLALDEASVFQSLAECTQTSGVSR
jgi:hypothetical protein